MVGAVRRGVEQGRCAGWCRGSARGGAGAVRGVVQGRCARWCRGGVRGVHVPIDVKDEGGVAPELSNALELLLVLGVVARHRVQVNEVIGVADGDEFAVGREFEVGAALVTNLGRRVLELEVLTLEHDPLALTLWWHRALGLAARTQTDSDPLAIGRVGAATHLARGRHKG